MRYVQLSEHILSNLPWAIIYKWKLFFFFPSERSQPWLESGLIIILVPKMKTLSENTLRTNKQFCRCADGCDTVFLLINHNISLLSFNHSFFCPSLTPEWRQSINKITLGTSYNFSLPVGGTAVQLQCEIGWTFIIIFPPNYSDKIFGSSFGRSNQHCVDVNWFWARQCNAVHEIQCPKLNSYVLIFDLMIDQWPKGEKFIHFMRIHRTI